MYRTAMAESGRFFQDVHATGRRQADDVSQANVGAFDLTIATFVAEVLTDLPDVGDSGGRDRVPLGLQTARNVDGLADRRGGPRPT